MKKVILCVVVAFFALAVSASLAHLYNRDDQYSLRYILWKYGVHPYPAEIMPGVITRDNDSDSFIRGKTIDQLKYMFPGEEFQIKDLPAGYANRGSVDKQYIQIGGTEVIIFLRDGKGETITITKAFL